MIIVPIAFLLLAIAFALIDKSIVNPVTVLDFTWSIVTCFSLLANKLVKCDTEIYQYIITGIIAFDTGYIIRKYIFKTKIILTSNRKPSTSTRYVYLPRYRLLYFLLTLCIVFFAKDAIFGFVHAGTFNLGNTQKMLQSGELVYNRSSLESAIVLLITQPLSFSIPAVTAVDFWYGKKDKRLFTLTIVMILLRTLSTGNRSSILIFFVFLFVCGIFRISNNRHTIENIHNKIRKYKRIIITIIIIAVTVFVIMTVSRGSAILRNVFLDLAIPPRMFELWKEDVDSSNTYGYGATSFMGFVYPVVYIAKNILYIAFPKIDEIFDLIQLTDTKWVWPGNSITANAYVSLFWFLYTDFRVPGIIFGMLVYGYVSAKMFSSASKLKDSRHICLYCLLFYTILYSFVRLQFSQSRIALGMIFAALFAYKKRAIVES